MTYTEAGLAAHEEPVIVQGPVGPIKVARGFEDWDGYVAMYRTLADAIQAWSARFERIRPLKMVEVGGMSDGTEVYDYEAVYEFEQSPGQVEDFALHVTVAELRLGLYGLESVSGWWFP